jgi:hypothetical protein
MADDAPVPDLLDERGRLRRIALSSVIAVVFAGLVFLIFDRIAEPDQMAGGWDGGSKARAYEFVYYFTGGALFVGFTASLAIQNALARRKDMRRQLPKAKAL